VLRGFSEAIPHIFEQARSVCDCQLMEMIRLEDLVDR
jgi:hypothetical protein